MSEKENDTMTERTGLEVAVIGMAGRFPGARDLEEFWSNLVAGVESISFFSREEMQQAGVDPARWQESGYVAAKGMIPDFAYFDAAFFDYSVREAEIMDPQVRLFHEVAWGALENAGYDPETYEGLIGVYAGANSNPRWISRFFPQMTTEVSELEVCNLSETYAFCTRVSYKLNLKGPSVTVQCACSTSLLSVHTAYKALLYGECDMALAGGSSVIVLEKTGYLYQEGMILSPDGHCRTFDARARGTVLGDGVGVAVLKRLDDALADRDTLMAVIKGSATNNDGNRKVGYAAPSMQGQADVIREAWQQAGIEPESIGYIEAHGTATPMGDPIEISALKLAFNTEKRGFCRIGSVKSNMGHLNNCAGGVGFIKTVLVLRHGLIPPSLHFETTNPEIDFATSPFIVNTGLYEWKRGPYPLRAGVNSIGGGGTNVHVVLEEWPAGPGAGGGAQDADREYRLILLSARTAAVLEQMTRNLGEYLSNHPRLNLADAAYTLQVGRRAFEYRGLILGREVREVAAALLAPGAETLRQGLVEKPTNNIIFMFPGQGAQYVHMGRELYSAEPVFRAEMDRCFEMLKTMMGYDLKAILYPGDPQPGVGEDGPDQPPSPALQRTEVAQPLLFVFEYALAKLLLHWGIKPQAMIGHSIGEYTAAHLAGVFSLGEALKLVVLRGKLMQQMPGGAMLSVQLPEDRLAGMLTQWGLEDTLTLAAVNSSSLVVVSGSEEAIRSFEARLNESGQRCTRLHTSHAFHSPMMDPIIGPFAEKLKAAVMQFNPPEIPYISNLTGQWLTPGEVTDPGYWAAHLRQPVRFADGVTELLKKKPALFLEVGPGQTLTTFVKKHRDRGPEHRVIDLVRHPREEVSDRVYLLTQIGKLWLAGAAPDWAGFHGGEQRRRIPLPTYPFAGQYFLREDPRFSVKSEGEPGDLESRLHTRKEIADWFYLPSWNRSTRYSAAAPVAGEALTAAASTWLVFLDDSGVGARLCRHLESAGPAFVIVKPGQAFTRLSQGEYTVNPARDSDYDALFTELRRLDKIPGVILHLWSLYADLRPLEEERVEKAQELGFYSLLFLAQALGRQEISDSMRLFVLTAGMQEVLGRDLLYPEKATVKGPCGIIPQEYPNIRCCSVDIQLPAPGEPLDEMVSRQVLTEITAGTGEPVVAYRGDYRWLPRYGPLRLAPGTSGADGVLPPLREAGVYLITGGLGGIGFLLAGYLASRVRARLILTGRTVFPARQEWDSWLAGHEDDDPTAAGIRQVRELEAAGAEISVCSADVTDFQQMREVVRQAEERFGPINGVIHAAGLADGVLIHQRTRQVSAEILAPKLKGTLVLHQVLKHRQLDLFVLFSSLSVILAPVGQVGYCAANAFLDAFACYRASREGQPVTSIDWDAWLGVGMAGRATSQLTELMDRSFTYGLAPEEGVEAFSRVISENIPLVAVSTTELQAKIEKWQKRDFLNGDSDSDQRTPTEFHARPDLSNPYVSPQDPLEQRIAGVLQDFLGLEKVGANDNFFELGATSMDIVQINGRLKKVVGKELAILTLFNHSTVRALGRYLQQEGPGEEFSARELETFAAVKKGKNKLKDQRRKRR